MKRKIAAIFIVLAILVIGAGAYYLYTQSDSQATFYVDNAEYYTVMVDRDAASLSLPEAPSKPGYVFDGWYFDQDAWTDPYVENYFASQKMPIKISLYAKFSREEVCGHNGGVSDWIIAEDATCTAEGTKVQKCLVCDAVLNTATIEIKPHTYTGVLDYRVLNGDRIFTFTAGCANCSFREVKDRVSVHSEVVKEADCINNGTTEYTYVYNGYEFSTRKNDIPLTAHKWNGMTQEEVIATYGGFATEMEGVYVSATTEMPACGSTCDAFYLCSVCGEMDRVRAIKSHRGSWIVEKAPSCLEEGKETLALCLDCKESAERAIPMLAHEHSYKLVADEDYEIFSILGTCTVTEGCTDTVLIENVAVTVSTTLPTCMNKGLSVYTGVYGGKTYKLERVLAPTRDHKIGDVPATFYMDENGRLPIDLEDVHFFGSSANLTCMTTYSGYYVCSFCHSNVSAEVYKPHDWSDWETVTDSTCVTYGQEKRVCTDCEDIDYSDLPYAPHTYEYTLHYNAGNDTFYLIGECTVENCDAVDESRTNVPVTHKAIATDLKIEYTYQDATTVCKLLLDADVNKRHTRGDYTFRELLDANGKLDYTKWGHLGIIVFGDDPLTECMVDREGAIVCDECGITFSVTVYRGHDLGAWAREKNPSCTELGVDRRVCLYEGCEGYEDRDVAMLDHAYTYTLISDGDGVAADAVVGATCRVCGGTTEITNFDFEICVTVDDPTCVAEGKVKYTFTKGDESYDVYVVKALVSDAHDAGSAHIRPNADGTYNANLAGIYIIANTESADGKTCRGGYICSHCHRFVEVTVKLK